MKKRLLEIALILIVLLFTIGITYARFQVTENVTGSINVYSQNYCLENGITKLSDCMLVMENYSENATLAKAYIESKGNSTTTAMAPTITYKEVLKEVSSTNYVITTKAHFTLGKSYTFNASTGMFTLTDYNNNDLSDEYIGYYTCGSVTGTYITCATMYQILEYTVTSSTTGSIYNVTKAIKHTGNAVDSFDSEIGLYSTTDDDGTTYFYRGNVKNNYVSYAGYIWRIVRLNGDGTVRMIYSGTSTSDTGENTSIGTSQYNIKYADPTYVGYKYSEDFKISESTVDVIYNNIQENINAYYGTGYAFNEETKKFTLTGEKISGTWQNTYESAIESYPYTCFSARENGTCDFIMRLKKYINKSQATVNYITYSSTSYESTLDNTNDSIIKSKIDTWYENNLLNGSDSTGTPYSEYLADSIFCNDRSIYSGTGYLFHQTTIYRAQRRIANSKNPSLVCSQDSDKFSVTNGNLKYPIALLTIDEVSFAGGLHGSTNTQYYLYTGQTYWTMSPAHFSENVAMARVWNVDAYGSPYINYVGVLFGVRPVINLKSDVEIIRGTGTADDPYVITE